MSKVNKAKLLSERTSGVPPVIFFFVIVFIAAIVMIENVSQSPAFLTGGTGILKSSVALKQSFLLLCRLRMTFLHRVRLWINKSILILTPVL